MTTKGEAPLCRGSGFDALDKSLGYRNGEISFKQGESVGLEMREARDDDEDV